VGNVRIRLVCTVTLGNSTAGGAKARELVGSTSCFRVRRSGEVRLALSDEIVELRFEERAYMAKGSAFPEKLGWSCI
jgi:hypothetical protein